MSLNRNTIFDALFALATAPGGFVTASQRLRHWTDVAAQPALFLRRLKDSYPEERPGRMPTVAVTLNAEFWIYYRTSDPDEAPGRMLGDLVTNLEDALRPSPWQAQQDLGLSPVVSHCWIAGDIDMDDGAPLDSGQAVARVPIKILAIS